MKANESLKPTQSSARLQPEGFSGGFFKIVVGSTALGLGCMVAALEALRRGAGGFAFQVSAGTFVAFAVGLAAALLYWKMAARSLWAVRVGAVCLVLAGLGGFLYPLRFVPADKLAPISLGLGVAVCALSTVAFQLWRLKRFFDADNAVVEIKNAQ